LDWPQMNASNFFNNDSAALEALINKKQARSRGRFTLGSSLPAQVADMMKLYGNLVERCFASCSTDFSTKSLNSKEQTCVEHCADKFLNLSNR
jgi:import inner membrane translocase subunit TIM9